MTSAQFKLDTFEGPLDLLLHLITKHKLNIYDIEIALLLEQYMEYINNLEHEDYEDAADFLEMAARLIYIKTCSLLPQDEEAQELKKELEGRIIEYSLCKKAAEKLREIYIGGEVFIRKPIKVPVNKTYTREHDPIVLYEAFMGISEKTRGAKPLKAEMFEPIVSHKIVSVTSKIISVLKKLYHSGEFDMLHLYDGMTSKSEKVATFLAVLELTKSGRIFLNDDNSKIFFNQNSRHKKIKSDFDTPPEEQTFESQTNIEETLGENSDYAEPFDTIESAEPQYEDNEQDTVPVKTRPHYKPVHKSMQERVKAVECSVVVKDIESDTDEQKPEIDNSSSCLTRPEMKVEAVSCDVSTENAKDDISECVDVSEKNLKTPISTADIFQSDNSFIEQNVQNNKAEIKEEETLSAEFIAELEMLSHLSAEPPVTVFKPNYWTISVYRWGNSPVGDDKCGNYWKFGYNRVRK